MVIPARITSIGDKMFQSCTGLTSVTIPNGVTYIGNEAFRNCTKLTSVTLPDSVTQIGSFAFTGCTALTRVTIPAGVASISTGLFANCTGLTSATFEGNAPDYGIILFEGAAPDFTIFYYDGTTGFTSPTWNGYPAVMVSRPPKPMMELQVISFTRVGETVSLTASGGQQGWNYELQCNMNLGAKPWATVGTVGPLAAAGPVELAAATGSEPQGFYRVVGHAP